MGATIGTRLASVIGPDATLRGDVRFAGDVKVAGEIQGNLHCDSLFLTRKGVISGDVAAKRVIVCGHVSGSIDAQEIYLKYGAVVEGDITHHQLTVEKGAILKGTSFPSEVQMVSGTVDTEGVVRFDLLTRIVSAGRQKLSSLRISRPQLQWRPKAETQSPETEESQSTSALSEQMVRLGPISDRLRETLRRVTLYFKLAASSTSAKLPEFLHRPNEPKRFRRYRFHILSPLTSLTAIAALALFWVARGYDPDPARNYPLSKTLEVPSDRELILLDAKGKPFARRGGCVDASVSLDEIPDHFIDALLATEDRRFFVHFGIDPVGIVRAARANHAAGKIVQGGSTITQQLAKISYLSSEKSFERKVKEAIAVLRLEASLTKREILERYLSRAYFGEGCFGLRAAARHYFKRGVDKLTVPQSAMLVALLKSPSQLAQDKKALRDREALVLDAMVDYGRLDPVRRAELKLAKTLNTSRASFGAFYADWIADTAKVKNDGNMAPLPIRTSFDPRLQRAADAAVRRILNNSSRKLRAGQAALVAMRPDGRVLAMVGGRNYGDSQFNRASQALRQPGSSFKAFVYLAAARAGGRPDMMVADVPITIGDWSPRNYDGRYRGIMPLRRAFSSSINTVSVRLTQAVGPHQVATAARDLGITTPISDEHPSIALGTSEVTLVDLTSAYAAFAANAYPIKPWGIVSMGARNSGSGMPPKGAGRWRLMEGGTMRQFLEATVQAGTGRAARLSIPSYGKTGTSQNYRDAWFVGFAGNLVVGVWVGNDDNTPMRRVTGGNLPAQIWKAFVSNALQIDRNSRRAPTRIAAFQAKPSSRRSGGIGSATLMSMLMDQEYMYASGYGSGAYFGNAMMFGRPRDGFYPGYRQGYPNYGQGYPGYGQGYPGYRQARPGTRRVKRRQRTGGTWDPFSNQN
ncbi:MAG: transglycosylase domain-containing protein [Hyphomicrobiaceae bacterium]|nr:transglycosylase domain-containing protein [Hyphomicrobiaceae bacterium]